MRRAHGLLAAGAFVVAVAGCGGTEEPLPGADVDGSPQTVPALAADILWVIDNRAP